MEYSVCKAAVLGNPNIPDSGPYMEMVPNSKEFVFVRLAETG